MRRLPGQTTLTMALLLMAGCIQDINHRVQSTTHGVQSYVQAGAENGTEWVGPVVPTDPNCGDKATGQMTLGLKRFSFAPFADVTVISGTVKENRLEGSATLAAPGQKGVAFQFAGTIRLPAGGPRVIEGTVTSGSCTWQVSLHRD